MRGKVAKKLKKAARETAVNQGVPPGVVYQDLKTLFKAGVIKFGKP